MQIGLTTARVIIRKCVFYGRGPAKKLLCCVRCECVDNSSARKEVCDQKLSGKIIYFRMKFQLERIVTVKYTCGVVKGNVTTKTVLFLGLTIEEA